MRKELYDDIVGEKIDKLTVLKFDHAGPKLRDRFYLCKCDCGNIVIKRRYNLKDKSIFHSCGCHIHEQAVKEIVGKRFGKLTVIAFDHYERRNRQNVMYVKCKCDCGKECIKSKYALTVSGTRSCGCLIEETVKYKTHGMSKTRFYKIWLGMKERCYGSENYDPTKYSRYGGRGITMCDSWKEDFINFYNDMYSSYVEHCKIYGEENTTLDRIDVNKGYSPDNCRWATWGEQAVNKQNTIIIQFNGEELPLSEAVRKYSKLPYTIVCNRIRRGWPVDKALEVVLPNDTQLIQPITFTEPHYICPFSFRN